ncbi:hypothetical protein BP6252_05174 [Coleophoma cylindrospora]|uniref:Zn(2)-C6 fungal-type domain-containing protein n=1 Tax=Coleophoma cylindrospora TaxID=1849047 RepID=A0A3D8RTI1_9HELO|nr:hypothetical protein BP6252_05174 [Coleophoma cylindrospora]
MPRPKKPGAPEPKKRSRNGCWPCKARKVKCDEARPTCVNCQKQGDTCDYSIKLNWEGRGKKKPDGAAGTGQIDFNAGIISVRPSQPSFSIEIAPAKGNTPSDFENGSTEQSPSSHTAPSDMSMIDPALVGPGDPLYPDGMFGGIRTQMDQGYAQSYERYHANTTPSLERPAKRSRNEQDIIYSPTMPPPNYTSFPSYGADAGSLTAPPSNSGTPPSHSDDGSKPYPGRPSSLSSQNSPGLRRLSVNSLLSGPPGIPAKDDRGLGSSNSSQSWAPAVQDETTTWGVDRGIKDLDVGKNDDMNAISGSSPMSTRDHLELVLDCDGNNQPVEFGFGSETAFESGGYYDKPVSISIPRTLEPLPAILLENHMNLLYFHHFINHTADCLVPHNCSSNPFKAILPRMAVSDPNLLSLLLAYSASHRARLLRQPEPAIRIALYVQDVFPSLRRALSDPQMIVSDSNLATAVMLTSLEIVSPKAFGVAVPWEKHLDTARQIISSRCKVRDRRISSDEKVSSFLWSWFSYLAVLGSLSGGNMSSNWILDFEIDEREDYQIDCILGFTGRCVRILAKIADFARTCDRLRVGQANWQPSDDIEISATALLKELDISRQHPAKPCNHIQSKDEAAYQWDILEMAATNEAFHWAGVIHIHRRLLGKTSSHPDVQTAVREVLGALYKVRSGSSAEACLLFPMFTAGCDVQEQAKRAYVLERIKNVERLGMTQVHQARSLMERVWETGKPWETLVAGEFFG